LDKISPVPKRNEFIWWGGGLLAGAALLVFGYAPLLRGIAAFLVVEDSLEPASAIVVLGGQAPFREMEAARLYRAGWAHRVVMIRPSRLQEQQALQKLGVAVQEGWELSREVLIRLGVPPSAIFVPREEAEGTLEELQIATQTLQPNGTAVILVTSKYHGRRVRLTWHYVTGGRSRGIVRLTPQDPFDPERWWRERRSSLSVVREYLGLLNYYAGFPIPGRKGSDGKT